jgi:hypothetical protein
MRNSRRHLRSSPLTRRSGAGLALAGIAALAAASCTAESIDFETAAGAPAMLDPSGGEGGSEPPWSGGAGSAGRGGTQSFAGSEPAAAGSGGQTSAGGSLATGGANDSPGAAGLPAESGGSGSSEHAGQSGGGGEPQQLPSCTGEPLVASGSNNYAFDSALTVPLISVKPGANLTLDWSDLSSDIAGNRIGSELDTVSLVAWTLPHEELEARIARDAQNSDSFLFVRGVIAPGQTSVELLELTTVADEPFTEEGLVYFDDATYPPANHTYTVIVSTGRLEEGGRPRMVQAFRLDPASGNTTVSLTDESSRLEYSVNLRDLEPLSLPVGSSGGTFEWGDLELDAFGGELSPHEITEVRLARFDQDPQTLEARFLQSESSYRELYSAEIASGTAVPLPSLSSETGEPFPGIAADAGATWLLALVAGGRRTLAPVYMTILEPCAE